MASADWQHFSHHLSLQPSNPLAIFHLAFSSLVNEQQKCARNVRQNLDRDSADCVGCDCCCDNSLWLTKYLSTHQARQRGTAVIAIAIATYFFARFLCGTRHLLLLCMDDFEILSGSFFSIFQRCFLCVFTFCLPAVTELTFHFYFRVVSFFCCCSHTF